VRHAATPFDLLTGRLSRHGTFRRLLLGQVGSAFGGQIGALAIPTIAIVGLHAGAMEVGILAALPWLPGLILGIPIGVFIDRVPRRAVMIGAEAGRWLVLAPLALVVLAHAVTLLHLYAAALLTGVLGTVFDIAYQSFMPSTLAEDELLSANSTVDVVKAPALVGGPAAAGFLLSSIGPAAGLLANAGGSAASLVSLLAISDPTTDQKPGAKATGVLADLRDGVLLVARSPVLRAIATAGGVSNLGVFMFGSVSLLFAYRHLHLSPLLVGVVFAIGNLGYLFGAAVAPLWVRELGLGRTLALSQLFLAISLFATPLAIFTMPVVLFAAAELLQNVTSEVFNLNQVSLRQAITPRALLGRMNATVRVGIVGAIPLGTLLGGYLGTTLGVVPTMVIGAAITLLAPLFVLAGPLIKVRTLARPEPVPQLSGQPAAAGLMAEPARA
jgi:MFS family permease